jgi:hypothetical protein
VAVGSRRRPTARRFRDRPTGRRHAGDWPAAMADQDPVAAPRGAGLVRHAGQRGRSLPTETDRLQVALGKEADRLRIRRPEWTGRIGTSGNLASHARASREPVRERLTFQVLHDEIRGAVRLADVVERADTRVIELGDGTSLSYGPRRLPV